MASGSKNLAENQVTSAKKRIIGNFRKKSSVIFGYPFLLLL
jgi:hypothetical protein